MYQLFEIWCKTEELYWSGYGFSDIEIINLWTDIGKKCSKKLMSIFNIKILKINICSRFLVVEVTSPKNLQLNFKIDITWNSHRLSINPWTIAKAIDSTYDKLQTWMYRNLRVYYRFGYWLLFETFQSDIQEILNP